MYEKTFGCDLWHKVQKMQDFTTKNYQMILITNQENMARQRQNSWHKVQKMPYLNQFYPEARRAVDEDMVELMDSTILHDLLKKQFAGKDFRSECTKLKKELNSFIDSSKHSEDKLAPYHAMQGALFMF